MTTTIDHILADIIASPDDDGIRLIAADWYDENGESDRAEFIRVQVALANADRSCGQFMYSCGELFPTPQQVADGGCERCKRLALLDLRERGLLCRHYGCWSGEVFPQGTSDGRSLSAEPFSPVVSVFITGLGCNRLIFRRGFVAEVQCTLAVWLRYGPAIVRRHPIERVEVLDKQPRETLNPSGKFRWYAVGQWDDVIAPDMLPTDLFDLIHDGKPGNLTWPSHQAAMDALSSGVIRLAKESPVATDAQG